VLENAKLNGTGEQFMNTIFAVKKSRVHRSALVKFSILLLAVFTFTGCETGQSSKQIAPDQSRSETIVLREGDVLNISFPSSPNLNTTQTIRRDGKISMPLVGEVEAAGVTPDELQTNLGNLFASQISSKEVTVAVESSSFPIYVTGYVLRPGKIVSNQPITALEAVMEAGVDYSSANLRAVRVIRRENGVSQSHTLNLKRILDGKDTKPFYLEPEDVVYVPEKLSLF
jgi:protein involved in polysaccharide export with SLBB domain